MNGIADSDFIHPRGPNVFDKDIFIDPATGVIRPGGLMLTIRLVEACAFPQGAQVVDIGCGTGITGEFFRNRYGLNAVGVDLSAVLLLQGKERAPDLCLIQAVGEDLPFDDGSVDGVIAECSLSVMQDVERVLAEIRRILLPQGKLGISDIYIRYTEGAMPLRNIPCRGCISGALTEKELKQKLADHGFKLMMWEDQSQLWKEFIARLIMKYGSLDVFWQSALTVEGDNSDLQAAIKKARLGYFYLVAEKE
jgi:arsenite methyltransferase